METNLETHNKIKNISIDISGNVWTFFCFTFMFILVVLNFKKMDSIWFTVLPLIFAPVICMYSIRSIVMDLTQLNTISMMIALNNTKLKLEESE